MPTISVPGVRVPFFVIVLVIGVVIALVVGKKLFSVRTIGRPIELAARAGERIATLMMTQEPYIPSLHRDPTKDRHRLDLVLLPTEGKASPQRFNVARHLPYSNFNFGTRLFGTDGNILWFSAPRLAAFDFKANKLIPASELLARNPAWRDLLESGHVELDGHLRLSSRDNRQWLEFDPETLLAKSIPMPKRTGGFLEPSEPDCHLCAGGLISTTNWFGMLGESAARSTLKIGSSVSKDYPVEKSAETRRLYQARIETANGRRQYMSTIPLATNDFIAGAMVRRARFAEPLVLSDPESLLILYLDQKAPAGTYFVARVDLSGKVHWQADTGIGKLQQILPDTRSLALIGERPSTPGKVSEPILVVVNTSSASVATQSLWLKDL